VPDSPTTPDPETPKPEADELAKVLPGLPVKIGHWTVNEWGFRRKAGLIRREREIAWRDVLNVARDSANLHVHVVGLSGAEYISVTGGIRTAAARTAESAWEEYVIRKMERDGALEGTVILPAEEGLVSRTISALVFLGMGGFLAWAGFRAGSSRAIAGIICAAAACWAATHVLFLQVAKLNRLRREWNRWTLSAAGLRHDVETGTRLVAFDEIVSTPEAFPPLRRMSHNKIAFKIIAAKSEALGLKRLPAPPLAAARLCGFYFLLMALPMAAVFGWLEGIIFACGITGFMAIMLIVLELVRMRPAMRRALTDGRAMLERLGW